MSEKAVVKLNAEGGVDTCAKGLPAGQCGFKEGSKVCGKCGALAVQVKADDDVEVIDAKSMWTSTTEPESGDMTDTMDPAKKKRTNARKRRLESMGMKSAEVGEDDYLCAFQRKMHPASAQPCASCPGGCAPEQGLPTILEVEGLAEEMFDGKALDSGYGDLYDMFLVHVERKDGKPVEVIFDGTTGDVQGWRVLNVGEYAEKADLIDTMSVIGVDDAMQIATKSVEGDVLMVDADEIEGADVWVVEIEGKDGMYHDVFVALDGSIIGTERWTAEEVADIDAEAAEFLMKRAYPDDERESMAESGEAMEDGSYPIKDEADLRNAIQAFGRAKDKPAARAHIMARAQELGLEDMLPSTWMEKELDDQDSDEFLATLMEFESLAAETEIDGIDI